MIQAKSKYDLSVKSRKIMAVEKHPFVVEAEDRSKDTRKALQAAERELEGYQTLLQKTLAGQVDALERELDQRNPLAKNRVPMTTGKIEEHIKTATNKVQVATDVLSRRQNEYFDAVEAAKIDLRDKFDEKHKTRVKSLGVSLERAAKWNDEVAEGEKEAADMGYNIVTYAWKELFPDRPLAASKLATWQRATKEYLDR